MHPNRVYCIILYFSPSILLPCASSLSMSYTYIHIIECKLKRERQLSLLCANIEIANAHMQIQICKYMCDGMYVCIHLCTYVHHGTQLFIRLKIQLTKWLPYVLLVCGICLYLANKVIGKQTKNIQLCTATKKLCARKQREMKLNLSLICSIE